MNWLLRQSLYFCLSCVVSFVASYPRYIEAKCDRLELNHLYDDHARPVFVQVIGWDFCDQTCRYNAQWFFLVDEDNRFKSHEGYATFWRCGELYRVHWTTFRESHTQYDPELKNRDVYPRELRTELPKR